MVEGGILLARPCRYHAAFYLIDPMQSLPKITAMQTLEIVWQGQATTPPTTQDPWRMVGTPTPTPSSTPLPTAPSSDLFTLYDINTRYSFQLTTREKQLYSMMYDGIAAFEDDIDFPEPFTKDELD